MLDTENHIDSISELKLKYPPIIVEEAPEATLNYDVNGPRIMIVKIENENFKSYAGLKILGPFHKNFTCIIGPNGSGKSNVIDALLFVFGFRASKIRSKKLSVLIHKSEMFPNINSCSVRVFFQMIKPFGAGDNDYDIIPNSEFIVTRTAFKDNSSVIKINNRKVTNKEVSEFLKKQGIDLDHNRFLILQGEVEQIAMMKPKAVTEYEDGLLEYLEDIIGSHRFKEPLAILFKRLEELCDLRTEKLNRVKVVAKEKKDLEGVRNEAVKYLRLCNEIVIRKNISFQIKLRELRLLEETAVEKQNEVKKELQKITDDIEKINQLKLTTEKELKEAVQNHLIKMQQFDISKKQFHELEIEDAELRDRRKHCKLNLDKLAKNIKLEEKELMKYEKVPEESVTRVEELLKEIKQLEVNKSMEMENQEKIRAEFEHETKSLQLDKEKKTEELRNYQDLLVKQEAELSSQKCSLNCLVGSYAAEEKLYLDLEEKVKSITVEITENKQKLEQLNVNIPKMNEEHQIILMDIENLKKEEAAIKAEVDVLFDKLQSGRFKQTEHKIIDFLFKQQLLGKVSGVYGRLGNLAAVDSKYDIAVSTACGRLDSIVTKEINNAQSCVELLKTCNIGSSTFIGLDKIQIWESRADRNFNSIAGAPRAFDLLTIPNKIFRCVFYFALRDLLITKDTKESVRINQQGKKYRMVTLKGETTEIHGAITGGGNRLIRGKICTDVSQICETGQQTSNVQNVDPQDLEQTHRMKEAKLNEVTQRIKDLTHKLELVKSDMINAYQNKKIIQELLNNNLIKETELKKELETLKGKLKKDKPDAVQVKKLETSIEQMNKKYKKDSEVAEKMTKEIDKINQEIELMGISKLQSVKSKIDAIVEEIKEKSGILKKINLSVKNAEKICKNVTKTLEQFKEEKIKNEEDFKNMETTLKELEKKAEETLVVYQKVNGEVNELLKLKDEQSVALSQINEEIVKSKQIQIQISRDFDDKKLKVDQIRKSIKQKQDEIGLLSCYVIPEDEDEAKPFMDLIGENDSDMNIFSSQKDSHVGTKLKIYSDEELVALRVHQITYQDMEDKLAKQKPNMGAIEEYRMKEELYMQRAAELNEVTQLRDYQREHLEKLKRQRHSEFSAGFNLITGKLKEMYQMITMGGDAELELVDSLDPFSEGILFSVRPPKKSWKNIGNLSGGEKTLSSLALVFALHHFKPTPFYVMDEIDAALDFKNVSIVATYLKERTKNAQFIIISLRNNMYELSDRLVGIYKPYNVSKTCLINPNSLSWCLSSMRDISKNKNSPTQTQPIEECTANKNVDEATISEITS